MDKRSAVRVVVQVRARFRAHGVVIDGLVEDVSRSGLFLRSPSQIQPGSPAEIDLELPDKDLQLRAEVVRIENGERPGMALKFAGALERSHTPLANFIMQQHHELR